MTTSQECQVANCTLLVVPPVPRSQNHRFPRPRIVHQYCYDHKCIQSKICSEMRLQWSRYCLQHSCQFYRCPAQIRNQKVFYCRKHICQKQGGFCSENLYCQLHPKVNRFRKRIVLQQFLEDIYRYSEYNYQLVDLIKHKIRWYLLDFDKIPMNHSTAPQLYDNFLKMYFQEIWEEKHGCQLGQLAGAYGPINSIQATLWSSWRTQFC